MSIKACLRLIALAAAAVSITACAAAPKVKDYQAFRAESPRSILVVPTLNNTVSVTAPDFFLSTISRPFAERGYYVFPAHMVRQLLNADGLSDPGLVHAADPRRLGTLFGCDAVLLVAIQQWDSKYALIATTTTVKFDYTLKSCKTGATIWEDTQTMAYSPQGGSSGNPLADLIAAAITAAIEKGMPNYMPLTVQANALAAGAPGRGIPAGPYLPAQFGKDQKVFP
ncbi:GNA1162 family protein [Caulobacter sp.]|uniref:GNA1162 family protein n=1 Tax=Caulobacter sp. TaxID=78 RepID=UPI0031DEE457